MDGVDIDNLLDAVIANEPATIHSDLIINGPVFSKIMDVNGTITFQIPTDNFLCFFCIIRYYRRSGQ